MLEFWINMGVTALFLAIKNPISKLKFRKISLKIFTTLKMTFAGDPDFACGDNPFPEKVA
jgi:hypothetical protein